MRSRLAFVVALLSCIALAAPLHAQPWPAKPLRMVVPFPPGGSTDIATRPVADRLAQILGQPVMVDNRTGAAGNIGADVVAKSPADGYTLLVTADSLASNSHLYKNLSFDPLKDLVPVVQLARQPVLLAVHPSLGVSTLQELVALARAKPGIAYATSGAGSQQHMTAEWFAQIAGLQLTHVPYKGGGQAITDLVGGQVTVASLGSSPLIPHYKSGRVKLLAQSTRTRAPALPEVPTYDEQGIKGLALEQWLGVFAPAGTPPEAIARLNSEIGRILAEPAIRERYAGAALEPVGGAQEQFVKFFRDEYDKYGRLTRELKIRLD